MQSYFLTMIFRVWSCPSHLSCRNLLTLKNDPVVSVATTESGDHSQEALGEDRLPWAHPGSSTSPEVLESNRWQFCRSNLQTNAKHKNKNPTLRVALIASMRKSTDFLELCLIWAKLRDNRIFLFMILVNKHENRFHILSVPQLLSASPGGGMCQTTYKTGLEIRIILKWP